MKKFLIIIGVIILVLAGLAGAAFYGFSKFSGSLFSNALAGLKLSQLQHEGGGFLNEVNGTVTVNREGAEETGADGYKLKDGDVVNVGAKSSAVIVWSGYGRSVLNENTTLRIDQAQGKDNAGDINVKIEMQAGRMWTRLQKLLSSGSNFSVQSSDVVATVRGTSFGTWVKDGSMDVAVMESHVGMSSGEDETMVGPSETMHGTSKPRAMTDAEMSDPLVKEGNRTMEQSEYLAPITLQRVLDSIQFPFYGMSKDEFVGFIASLPDIKDLQAQYPDYFRDLSQDDLMIYQKLIDQARAWAQSQSSANLQVETRATLEIK